MGCPGGKTFVVAVKRSIFALVRYVIFAVSGVEKKRPLIRWIKAQNENRGIDFGNAEREIKTTQDIQGLY